MQSHHFIDDGQSLREKTKRSTHFGQDQALPRGPSLKGRLFYLLMWFFLKLHPLKTLDQLRSQPAQPEMSLPPDISLERIAVGDVSAQYITAPGATREHVLLFIHGGAFALPLTNAYRSLAVKLSQATGASVLLPEYRLSPEHPFPAALHDCTLMYRWLLTQGVKASHIVILGDSAGGNLTLATALLLRESGALLPAGLVALSAATDLTMAGATYRSKMRVDPLLGSGLAKSAFAAYTSNGLIDSHDPLVSPLYARLDGLPPTLLQVGTQEVLLSDTTRMAQRFQDAGVEVTLEIWPGMWHVWHLTGDSLPEARQAIEHMVKHVRDCFSYRELLATPS